MPNPPTYHFSEVRNKVIGALRYYPKNQLGLEWSIKETDPLTNFGLGSFSNGSILRELETLFASELPNFEFTDLYGIPTNAAIPAGNPILNVNTVIDLVNYVYSRV